MRRREDKLSEALARLKQDGLSQDVPQEVVDETLRRLADSSRRGLPMRTPGPAIPHLFKLAAAAVLVFVAYAVGRLSAPEPMNPDQIREVLTPSVAAAVEPAIRARLVEEMRHDYQLALAATYVRVKEELTAQYRDDLNRFALGTLAASNAVTNELLTQLVQALDTAKAEDLRRIARALYEIEMNRVQDRTQLASGLQTLASRTENELSRTKQEFVQLLVDVRPRGFERPSLEPPQTHQERNRP